MKPFKKQFDQLGYTVIKNFLPMQQVAHIDKMIDQLVINQVPEMPKEHVFYEDKNDPTSLKQLQHLDRYHLFFKGIFESTAVVSLAETLLGATSVAKNMQWFNKPPQIGKATPPHQDGYYFMLEPNIALTMWLALDSVDESNGCIRYLPGSHKKGMRPHGATGVLGFSQGIVDYNEDDLSKELPIIARPGDLLVHHSKTIHRADANKSKKSRKGLGFIFYSENAKEDKAKHEAYQRKLRKELSETNKI